MVYIRNIDKQAVKSYQLIPACAPNQEVKTIMQLLTATVKERPRVVETKYGTRVVIDAICQGHEVTIWRGFPDTYAVNLKGGQQVNVTLDSKGKYSLVDNAPQTTPVKPYQETYQATPDYNAHNGRSAEIADYTARLAKLYSHCYRQTAQEMGSYELEGEDMRAIATTLFIQTVKHFDL
jgi:hypothetical protein